jgi:hypothetical protein
MRAANRRLEVNRRITGFDLQLREWDFAANPSDPNHGRIVQTYSYRVPSGE